MRQAIAAIFLALLVAACPSPAPTGANDVYAAKNSFAAAQTLAIQYTSLPRCGAPTSPPLCSDQTMVVSIRKYNADAVVALDAAEKTVRDPTTSSSTRQAALNAATNAVAAFQTIVSQARGK